MDCDRESAVVADLASRLRWFLNERPTRVPEIAAVGRSGPAAGDILYWLYRLEAVAQRARSTREGVSPEEGTGCPEERTGVSAYGNSGRRISRRLAEVLRPCGLGVDHGLRLLRAEFKRTAPMLRRSGPQPGKGPRIGMVTWAHIACSVRAEAAICSERAMAARAGARETDMAQRAAESVAELARLAEQLFRDMSRLPGFRAWRPMADPLYRAWLDGALSRTAAPPPLFRNRQDFYSAFPQLASGWDALGTAMAPSAFMDNLPLGSLERQVQDQDGVNWALIVAVPKDGADPREWNEPNAAVVAARVPRWSADALCYVLAHTVVPRRVLPHLRGPRAFDSLEGVAAALAMAT